MSPSAPQQCSAPKVVECSIIQCNVVSCISYSAVQCYTAFYPRANNTTVLRDTILSITVILKVDKRTVFAVWEAHIHSKVGTAVRNIK
jgi:hypothetical protein